MLIVQGFAGVLLQVQPLDADAFDFAVGQVDLDFPFAHDRCFILGNLVAEGQIRVKIVLTRKNRAFVDFCVDRQSGPHGLADGFLVQDGQHARHGGIDEADLRVGGSTEGGRRSGEQFGFGRNLGMDFQSNHDFPIARLAFQKVGHDFSLLR